MKYVVTMSWRIHRNHSDHDATVLCGDEEDDEDGPTSGLPVRPWFKKPDGTDAQQTLFNFASEGSWKELAVSQVKRRQDAEQMLNDVKAEAVTLEVLSAAPSRRRRTQRASEPLPVPIVGAAAAATPPPIADEAADEEGANGVP